MWCILKTKSYLQCYVYKPVIQPNYAVGINTPYPVKGAFVFNQNNPVLLFITFNDVRPGQAVGVSKTYIFVNGGQSVHHLGGIARMKFIAVGILVVFVAFAAVALAEDGNYLLYFKANSIAQFYEKYKA